VLLLLLLIDQYMYCTSSFSLIVLQLGKRRVLGLLLPVLLYEPHLLHEWSRLQLAYFRCPHFALRCQFGLFIVHRIHQRNCLWNASTPLYIDRNICSAKRWSLLYDGIAGSWQRQSPLSLRCNLTQSLWSRPHVRSISMTMISSALEDIIQDSRCFKEKMHPQLQSSLAMTSYM
jgi:hypothetical protein